MSRNPADESTLALSGSLHDLVLGEPAMGVGIHGVTTARRDVLDVVEAERATAVLVVLELGDRSLGSVRGVEADNAAASGPAARLVLDLGLLDLTDGGEELDQIFVARRPGELGIRLIKPNSGRRERWDGTYVANIDSVALLNTRRGIVGERVRGHGDMAAIEAARSTATAITTTTAAIAAESTTASAKAAAAIATAKGTASASEAAAAVATGTHGRTGEAVLTNLEHAALPVVAVELLDGVAGIVGRLENHNARALGPAVRAEMDIGANNTACASCQGDVVNAQFIKGTQGVYLPA
jgi:hypothetical protein